MKRNRRYKRFSVDVMNIRGRMTVSSRVDLLDINSAGVKLKADLRFNIGSEYVLRLQDEEKSMKLKGLVEWSSISEPVKGLDDEIIPMYTADMKFHAVSGDALSDLNYFIEVFNTAEEERLSGIGLQIDRRENAMIDQSQDYKVKKVSLSGMLIGSGSAFVVDSVFPMELTLPGNRLLHFIGRITSCSPANTINFLSYEVGVAFLEMPDQDKEMLREFIRKLDEEGEEEADIWYRHKHL